VGKYSGQAAAPPAAKAGIELAAEEQRSVTTFRPDAATRATLGRAGATPADRASSLATARQGALCGFATMAMPVGLTLIDCPVLASNGRTWVIPPAEPVLDRDDKQKTDANGKLAYAAVVEWRSHELSDRFSEVVLYALRRRHPGALHRGG
jgi:hypothetical protein